MKRVIVLGSTGSIGTNTLDVIAQHPDSLEVLGLSARSRLDALAEQVARHRPARVAVWDEAGARELRARSDGATEIVSGIDGLTRLATDPRADVVVVGTAGIDALVPVLRAIEAGKRIALASKELLVVAGELLMRTARAHDATIIPVDSEHAALFQALHGVPTSHVARLVLTGTGGSLWTMTASSMETVTVEQVLRHPKWSMGRKITVDSATLMNKGLEVIEAHWLFDLPYERIQVVIHPQALIHAIIEITDGTALAHMCACDMRLPIQYALSYPERWPSPLPRLDWAARSGLEFFEPDLARFPCLRIALEAASRGGTACAALSAANEVAVEALLSRHLPFTQIARVVESVVARHAPVAHPSLEDILAADRWAREEATNHIEVTCHS